MIRYFYVISAEVSRVGKGFFTLKRGNTTCFARECMYIFIVSWQFYIDVQYHVIFLIISRGNKILLRLTRLKINLRSSTGHMGMHQYRQKNAKKKDYSLLSIILSLRVITCLELAMKKKNPLLFFSRFFSFFYRVSPINRPSQLW